MTTKGTLIVGLLATVGSGLLQAETLTFNFTTSSASTISFPTGTNQLSGNIDIQSIGEGGNTSTCVAGSGATGSCTLSFETGALNLSNFQTINLVPPSPGPAVNLSTYFYQFASSGSSFSAQVGTGTGAQLDAPNTSTQLLPAGSTMATGTLGTSQLSGTFLTGASGATLTFSSPLSAVGPANLQTILTAFGLPTGSPLTGSLSFIILTNGQPNTSTGAFTGGVIQSGTLSLNVIPEPSSILLIGLGLIGVAFIGRKRLLTDRL